MRPLLITSSRIMSSHPSRIQHLQATVFHTAPNFTTDGVHILMLDIKEAPNDNELFAKPTAVAVASYCDVYVSDGYGNTRIHVFSGDGDLKQTEGLLRVWDGDINLPHTNWIHKDMVYVADRENHRAQVFNLDGTHAATWTDIIQPTAST